MLLYISPQQPIRQEKENAIFADFNKQHADIQVRVEGQANGWQGTWDKFLAAHAAGQPISFVHNGWLIWENMWKVQAIVDLTEYFKRDKLDPKALWIESAIWEWTIGNVMGGMPISTSADALAWNKELFAQAGLREPPVDPNAKWWNMDTFLEYCQKLTKGKEQFGFGGGLAGGYTWYNAGTYFGGGPWDDEKKLCTIDTPPFHKGLEYFRDLTDVKYHFQPNRQEREALLGGRAINIFVTGKIGMNVAVITQEGPFKWGIATLPYSGDGPSMSARISNHGLQMGAVKPEEREAVWTVFKWFMKPENGGRFPRTAGHVVSPFKDPAFSAFSQKEYMDQLGVDPKAHFLQAQHTRPDGWGILKYGKTAEIEPVVAKRFNEEYWPGRLATKEFTAWAAKYYNDNMGLK